MNLFLVKAINRLAQNTFHSFVEFNKSEGSLFREKPFTLYAVVKDKKNV